MCYDALNRNHSLFPTIQYLHKLFQEELEELQKTENVSTLCEE